MKLLISFCFQDIYLIFSLLNFKPMYILQIVLIRNSKFMFPYGYFIWKNSILQSGKKLKHHIRKLDKYLTNTYTEFI